MEYRDNNSSLVSKSNNNAFSSYNANCLMSLNINSNLELDISGITNEKHKSIVSLNRLVLS